MREFESRIAYAEGAPGTMTIEDLEVVSPGGRDMLKEKNVVVRSGERAAHLGAPGTGKTCCSARWPGLWPWGTGRSPARRASGSFICRAARPICRAARCARFSPIR